MLLRVSGKVFDCLTNKYFAHHFRVVSLHIYYILW